jgi:hypothetical protein
MAENESSKRGDGLAIRHESFPNSPQALILLHLCPEFAEKSNHERLGIREEPRIESYDDRLIAHFTSDEIQDGGLPLTPGSG